MRFILDSTGLVDDGEIVSEHTFYQASVRGQAINLMEPPWLELSHLWKHPADYSATHKLAEAAVAVGVQWVQYESVRKPDCALAAVLTPHALFASQADIDRSRQEWVCKATRDTVMMIRKGGAERFQWSE